MSLIPSMTASAAQIAGSAAGALRREGVSDRAAEAGAEQRITSDRQELASRSLGDVGETDGSTDRDADGCRHDSPSDGVPAAESGETGDPAAPERCRVPDVSGELGTRLDVDA